MGQGKGHMDMVEGEKVVGLGTAARSPHWHTNRGATTIQAVGFGISQVSADVPHWCQTWMGTHTLAPSQASS